MSAATGERTQTRRKQDRRRWWKATAGGLPLWAWAGVTVATVAFAVGFGAWWTYGRGGSIPAVQGFYDGRKVTFIHTEVSDAKVAQTLTGMVSSPVLVVPELAGIPASALGAVYVFTNGIEGPGPEGFQSDVFDSAPSDPSYSPLRALILVTWKDGAGARVLTSVREIRAAAAGGEVRIERTGIVLNMPFVSWPGGHR